MTDLERLGRHVGEQHAVAFWITLRAQGWERYLEPQWSWSAPDAISTLPVDYASLRRWFWSTTPTSTRFTGLDVASD